MRIIGLIFLGVVISFCAAIGFVRTYGEDRVMARDRYGIELPLPKWLKDWIPTKKDPYREIFAPVDGVYFLSFNTISGDPILVASFDVGDDGLDRDNCEV